MKIAYLHGLESSINQDDPKIQFLNKSFDEAYMPSINYRDDSTFDRLLKDIKRMQPDLIVGSSMGGYVSYLIGNKLSIPTLLFNPALVGRSFDPVVDDSGLKGTDHTILLGKNDKVISGREVKKFLREEGVGQFNYESYDGGHRVPADVFINEIKKRLGIKEIYTNMKHVKLFEQFVNESRVANKWDIESHHIGKLQKGHMDKFTEGTSMPFSLVSRPTSGISVTDSKLVVPYVDANHLVISFYPMEDSNNDTMYDAVKKDAIKVLEKLIKKEYGLKLKETLKGKRHCSSGPDPLCSVSHYLVFGE